MLFQSVSDLQLELAQERSDRAHSHFSLEYFLQLLHLHSAAAPLHHVHRPKSHFIHPSAKRPTLKVEDTPPSSPEPVTRPSASSNHFRRPSQPPPQPPSMGFIAFAWRNAVVRPLSVVLLPLRLAHVGLSLVVSLLGLGRV
jgi:hypothetical protein